MYNISECFTEGGDGDKLTPVMFTTKVYENLFSNQLYGLSFNILMYLLSPSRKLW